MARSSSCTESRSLNFKDGRHRSFVAFVQKTRPARFDVGRAGLATSAAELYTPGMRFDISDVIPNFPDFRVAILVATDIAVRNERSPALSAFIADCEDEARKRWGGVELSAIPGIAAWRRVYRAFGIKKTSYRSSVERLVKNNLAGGSLPAINGFVDAYNAISLKHVLPSGADDLDLVRGDLAFRYARRDDDFRDMGALDEHGEPLSDPPKEGEVVYADAEKILCRRWNWRQDARSAIRQTTRRAVVTLQQNGIGNAMLAAEELTELLREEGGGFFAITLLDSSRPSAELPIPE
jgi:DNA/RNA-binding domain of Phe-tRNA-synthetase-like protein